MTASARSDLLARVNAKLNELAERVNGCTDSRAEIQVVFAKTIKGIQNELAKARRGKAYK